MVVIGRAPLRRHEPPAILQWGQVKSWNEAWVTNESRPVVTLNQIPGKIPVSKTIALAAKIPNVAETGISAYFCIFRWVMQFGVGGGNATFIFDANRLTQVAVPAETVVLSLKAEPLRSDIAFSSPTTPIQVSAFLADGPTTTSPPTYSQLVSVPRSSTVNFVPPPGATGFRIGPGAMTGIEITADVVYSLINQSGTSIIDQWDGADIATFADRLEIIPIPGAVGYLSVLNNNAGVDASFWLIWSLDL